MFRLKRVLGYTADSLSDCAFDLVHMHRGKLVFECLLCALEVLVQGGMDVSADRAERGVLVEMEERVCLGLVDRKQERDVFEQTREAYAALAFAAAAMACLSVVAAFLYGGKRFEEHFADFCERFGIEDMYSGGLLSVPGQGDLLGMVEPLDLAEPLCLPGGRGLSRSCRTASGA